MLRSTTYATALITFLASQAANSAPLTCEQFKGRLSDTIESAGNKVAQIKQYQLASDDSGIKRYDWRGIAGLHGQILCASNDRFDRFDIMIDVPGNRSVMAALPRMRDLASATMCSVVQSQQSECDRLAVKMFKITSTKLSNEIKRGEELAQGSSDYNLYPQGWWVSLSADDVSVIFGMGPGPDGGAERKKLAPVDLSQ